MFGEILRSLFGRPEAPEKVPVVKTVFAPDGQHRVVFFRREADGVSGFREEYYDNKSLEMTWQPVSTEGSHQYPDLDAAIAAAQAQFPWLHGAM